MSATMPVLVAGATGGTGRLVVAELLAAGIPVRALVRDATRGAALGPAVTLATGDVREPATLPAAVRGAGAVISVIGARSPIGRSGFRAVDWEGNRALVDAARDGGVRRFILVTAGSAGRAGFPYSLPVAPYPWKGRAEAHLRASGLEWTIVGPGGLTDDAATDRIRAVPREDYRTGRISRADVARVVAACLAEPRSAGRVITLVADPAAAPGAWRAALAG